MVPIHDTDLAEERWTKSEWEYYELWEKIELRQRKRKRLWIAATAGVFLVLSAVPVFHQEMPQWTALAASRQLAQEIGRLKREANAERVPLRIRFPSAGEQSLQYRVERVRSCTDAQGALVREGALLRPERRAGMRLLDPAQGEPLGLGKLTREYCYDPIRGSQFALDGQNDVGFAFLAETDLTEQRSDRLAVLVLSGPDADPTFE